MDFVYFIKTENRLTSSSLCHHSLNVPALTRNKNVTSFRVSKALHYTCRYNLEIVSRDDGL